MWIKIICIEYILWGIPTIESTFDVANMVKTATVKDVPINNDALLNIQACYIHVWEKWHLVPYLVVPLISARVPLTSTRVSAHCQAILLIPSNRFYHVGQKRKCTGTSDINICYSNNVWVWDMDYLNTQYSLIVLSFRWVFKIQHGFGFLFL